MNTQKELEQCEIEWGKEEFWAPSQFQWTFMLSFVTRPKLYIT